MYAILLLSSLSFLPSIYSGEADENSKADEKSKPEEESTWYQFKDMIKRSSYDTFVLPFEFLWDAVRGFPEEDRSTSERLPPTQNPGQQGSAESGHSSGPYVPPSSSYGLPNAYRFDKGGLGDQKTESPFGALDALQNRGERLDTRSMHMQSPHVSTSQSTSPKESDHDHDVFVAQ